jgi:hypothetical protein
MSRGRNIGFIARKDVQYFLREKEVLLWLFIMPALFMYFIGTVSGGGGVRGPQKDHLAVNSLTNGGFLAAELIHRLEENDYAAAGQRDELLPPAGPAGKLHRLRIAGDPGRAAPRTQGGRPGAGLRPVPRRPRRLHRAGGPARLRAGG